MVQIWGFSAAVCFKGNFEEIGIAKVLLGTKTRRVEKFRDVCFPMSEKVWRKKEKNSPHGDHNNNVLCILRLV